MLGGIEQLGGVGCLEGLEAEAAKLAGEVVILWRQAFWDVCCCSEAGPNETLELGEERSGYLVVTEAAKDVRQELDIA